MDLGEAHEFSEAVPYHHGGRHLAAKDISTVGQDGRHAGVDGVTQHDIAMANNDSGDSISPAGSFVPFHALVAVSKEGLLMFSGAGDVLEPDGGVIGIGSGGPYALAAAKALLSVSEPLTSEQIARRALEIAGEIDIYTNDQITLEEITW